MEPFRVALPLKELIDIYPTPEEVLSAARTGGEQARVALARLWLSEGIPCAFRECPAVYESIRSWLSNWINVHPKEIGLSGSARLGCSLSPNKLGKPFGINSDLDLFVISSSLFERLRDEFLRWSFDFESGKVTASNEREATFWRDNNERGPKLIQRGFIDQEMIPNKQNYQLAKKISQAMWLLVEKLKLTSKAPHPKHASVRCYTSWDSFVRQMSKNLEQS